MAVAAKQGFLRQAWDIAWPYWKSEEKWSAIGLLAAVITLNLIIVWLNVRFNYWNNDFYNALQQYDWSEFWRQFAIFGLLATGFIIVSVYSAYLERILHFRWRRWQTKQFLHDWLKEQTYYRMQLKQEPTDNPDQRIQEDLDRFAEMSLSLSLGLFSAFVTLVSFLSILWTLSGALTIPVGGGAAIGRAAWDPERAIPAALGWLEAVEGLAPAGWRSLLDQLRAVLLAVRQRAPALPFSVVHGDPWPGNAIHTAQDQVILIGWENAGLGLPLLDLGFCLLECHLDVGQPGNRPSAWHIHLDEKRIAAIVAGYSRWRQLQPAEKDLLLEGIRFPAAYVGAIDFEQALLTGVRGRSMDVRLERLQNRLAVSDAVADLARGHFG